MTKRSKQTTGNPGAKPARSPGEVAPDLERNVPGATQHGKRQAIYHRFDSALDANNIETVECTNVDGKQDLTDAVEAKRWLHDDKPALPVYIKIRYTDGSEIFCRLDVKQAVGSMQAAIDIAVGVVPLLMVAAFGWALAMLFKPVSMPVWILLWGPVGASAFVALFTITVYRRAAFRRGLLALLPVPCLTLNAVVQAGILIAKHAFCVWQGILLVTPLGFAVLAYMVAVTAQWMPSVGCAVNHLAKASPSFAVATWAVVLVTPLYMQDGASAEEAAWVAAAAFLSFAVPALHFMVAVPVAGLLSAYKPIVPEAFHFTLTNRDFRADPTPYTPELQDACICFVKKGLRSALVALVLLSLLALFRAEGLALLQAFWANARGKAAEDRYG